MNNQLFQKTQVIDLEHMLEEAKDDPVLGRQLEQRVRAAKTTLQEETPDGTLFPPVTPEHIAQALITAAESDSADQFAETIPAKVLQPLTRFFRTLANYKAELRLALPDGRSRIISSEQATGTAERLEKTIDQKEIDKVGTFRGLTRESGYFDLLLEDGTVVTGIVADAFTEEDLDRIDSLTNAFATINNDVLRRKFGTLIFADERSCRGSRLGGLTRRADALPLA